MVSIWGEDNVFRYSGYIVHALLNTIQILIHGIRIFYIGLCWKIVCSWDLWTEFSCSTFCNKTVPYLKLVKFGDLLKTMSNIYHEAFSAEIINDFYLLTVNYFHKKKSSIDDRPLKHTFQLRHSDVTCNVRSFSFYLSVMFLFINKARFPLGDK